MEQFKYPIKMEAFVRLEKIEKEMKDLVEKFSDLLNCATVEYFSAIDNVILQKNHLVEDEYYVIGPKGYTPTIRTMSDRGVWIQFKKRPNAKENCPLCEHSPCQCDNYEHPEPPDNS